MLPAAAPEFTTAKLRVNSCQQHINIFTGVSESEKNLCALISTLYAIKHLMYQCLDDFDDTFKSQNAHLSKTQKQSNSIPAALPKGSNVQCDFTAKERKKVR